MLASLAAAAMLLALRDKPRGRGMKRTTSSTWMRSIAEVLSSLGLDAHRLFADAGIDLDALAVAFSKRLAKHMKHKVNPFAQPVEDRFTAPPPPETSGEQAAQPGRGRGRGRKKQQEPTANEVLRT